MVGRKLRDDAEAFFSSTGYDRESNNVELDYRDTISWH